MSSRRNFIRLVLGASGATYALGLAACGRPPRIEQRSAGRIQTATPQFATAHRFLRDRQLVPTPDHTEEVDVLVVGAGVSGLAAAAWLEQQGRSPTVVENDVKPGGAAQSASLAGGLAPLGSVYFVDTTPELQLLLDKADITPVDCPEDAYDVGRGTVVRDLWTDAVLDTVIADRADREGMKRFRDQLLALGDRLPPYPLPETLEPWQAALDQPAESWVKSFGSPTLMTILNAYSRSSLGALLSSTNVYCLQNFYASEFGTSFGLQRYTIPGGPGVVTAAVASRLGDVRAGHVCVRVRQHARFAEADCVDQEGRVVRFRARAIIMAGPKFQVPHLVEDLPELQAQACSMLAYAPYMTIHVVSDEPLTEPSIYDTWNLNSDSETDVVNPGSVPGNTFDGYVASLFVPMDRFARGQLVHDELFVRKVADIIEQFLRTRSESQRASVREVYAWGWGHGLVIPTPGSHSGIAQRAARPHGRIVFANADCDAAPAMEGAASHGVRAAGKAALVGGDGS